MANHGRPNSNCAYCKLVIVWDSDRRAWGTTGPNKLSCDSHGGGPHHAECLKCGKPIVPDAFGNWQLVTNADTELFRCEQAGRHLPVA